MNFTPDILIYYGTGIALGFVGLYVLLSKNAVSKAEPVPMEEIPSLLEEPEAKPVPKKRKKTSKNRKARKTTMSSLQEHQTNVTSNESSEKGEMAIIDDEEELKQLAFLSGRSAGKEATRKAAKSSASLEPKSTKSSNVEAQPAALGFDQLLVMVTSTLVDSSSLQMFVDALLTTQNGGAWTSSDFKGGHGAEFGK